MKTWLSIDFDYFVRERYEWDWGHSEMSFLGDSIWAIREASFLAQGINLREEMSPERHAEPGLDAFWQTLERHGFEFDGARIVVADSHSFGATTFVSEIDAYPADGRRLVHFDAHHDLGYDVATVRRHLAENRPDCADWHLFTLKRWPELQSLIVYPAWKGLTEWDATFGRVEGRVENDVFRKQVRATVWPDPVIEEFAGEVETVFLCRSGSWTPPWLDGQFIQLVNDLEERAGTEPTVPFREFEKCNPLQKRQAINRRSVEAHARVFKMTPTELAEEILRNKKE